MLRRFSLGISRSFAAGLKEVLERPLLGGDVRCALSGRLLHHSPRLAGAVYSHFNVLLLLALVALAAVILYAGSYVI